MGNLINLTLYGDRLCEIEKNPERFVRELVAASRVPEASTIFGQTKVQGYKPSSEPALYVQMGNTCCLLDPYEPETRKLAEENKEFYGKMVNYVDKLARELRLLQNSTR